MQGYSNGYAHYLTTESEYDAQRYEGGSTVFGRYELAAFIEASCKLAADMRDQVPTDPGRPPRPSRFPLPSLTGRPIWARNVTVRALRWPTRAFAGQTVEAEFVSNHPNGPIRDEYFRIEHWQDSMWRTVADDASFSTQIRWRRSHGRFTARVSWTIPDGTAGRFRIGFAAANYTVFTPEFVVARLPIH